MSLPPASPMRNNYAAPNTPIASSKRARVTAKDAATMASPARGKAVGCMSRPIVEESRKTGADMHGASPSKNLFSPHLKYDGTEVSKDDSYEASTPPRDEAVQQQQQTENDDDDDDDVFNPYQFISCLPSHESVYIKGKICLPSKVSRSRITLALDLDETLVHCTIEPIENPDLIFPVKFNDVLYQVYVRKRPYLDYFLETVSKMFEVVVFTASQKVYADTLLNMLDPEHRLVEHRLFREACVLVQGNYLKDLTVLGRDLQQTVLVDNSPHAYGYQIDNGIPIESWFDEPSDSELLKLVGFLKHIVDADDVRPFIHDHFKTFKLVHNARLGLPVSLSAPPF